MATLQFDSLPTTSFGFAPQSNGSGRHRIGGRTRSAGAECPNCKRDLTLVCLLETGDPKLSSLNWKWPQVELLFCWQCELSQGKFSYQCIGPEDVKLLAVTQGEVVTDFPYENYPRYFTECPVELEPLDESLSSDLAEYFVLQASNSDEIYERWEWARRDSLTTPRHQLGGIPFLFDYSTEFCPACSKKMFFLATIADKTPCGEHFTGAEFVQTVFYVCPECMVVSARQECD